MKVVHLSYSATRGGAAIGAYRLHSAMMKRGLDSTMLALDAESPPPGVHPVVTGTLAPFHKAVDHARNGLIDLYQVDDLSIRSFNFAGAEASHAINAMKPDIVQFHWVANGTIALSDIRNIEAPIVWKMPDMWPFCGGEHYVEADEPQRHRKGYDQSPPFRDEAYDVDRLAFEYKRRAYDGVDLTIVSPSRFLAREAHSSALLGRHPAHVIPNPLPKSFRAAKLISEADKGGLRAELGLDPSRLTVFFGAFTSGERRKGFHHLLDLIENHLPARFSPDALQFMVAGADKDGVERFHNYLIRYCKQTSDTELYKQYLQSADVVLFPSRMDSTAMVVQEGLALGLPAVVFGVGGLVDLVHHKKSGYAAEPYEVAQLADGLSWFNELQPDERETVRSYCVALARSAHDEMRCVDRYVSLYEQVLRDRRTGRTPEAAFHDREAAQIEPERAPKLAIIDPSARRVDDGSHNAAVVLTQYVLAQAAGFEPMAVVNQDMQLPEGVNGRSVFTFTAYDAVRNTRDVRDDEPPAWIGPPESRAAEIADALSGLVADGFGPQDRFFFPMMDRACAEGALLYLSRTGIISRSPELHLLIMFEHGDFMTGGYDLAGIMTGLKNTRLLGEKIFVYAETEALAKLFRDSYDVDVRVLRTPGLSAARQAPGVDQTLLSTLQALIEPDAEHASDVERPVPAKGADELWVVAPGRGRADKGWADLPEIAAHLRRLDPEGRITLVTQDGRAMDNLDDARERLEEASNVKVLPALLSPSDLSALLDQADMVLLPYLPQVYAKRGSAFIWEAIARGKPVVTRSGTALCERLSPNAAMAARTPSEFARAILAIANSIESFRNGAGTARDDFVRTVTLDCPLFARRQDANLSGVGFELFVGPAEGVFDQGIKKRRPGPLLTLDAVKPDKTISLPTPGDERCLGFHGHLANDGQLVLPEAVRDGLSTGAWRKVHISIDLDERLRAALIDVLPEALDIGDWTTRARPRTAVGAAAKAPDDLQGHLEEIAEARDAYRTWLLAALEEYRHTSQASQAAYEAIQEALYTNRPLEVKDDADEVFQKFVTYLRNTRMTPAPGQPSSAARIKSRLSALKRRLLGQ